MSSRDDIPDEVRRMSTSDLVRVVAAPDYQPGGDRIGYRFTDGERAAVMRQRQLKIECAAELDARIPPRLT